MLLILAGITIATLTGDNGILTRTNDAKVKIHIAEEKEIVQLSALGAQKKLTSEIEEEELRKELTIYTGGEDKYKLKKNGDIYEVTFEDCGRIYTIDAKGNITLDEESKENPGGELETPSIGEIKAIEKDNGVEIGEYEFGSYTNKDVYVYIEGSNVECTYTINGTEYNQDDTVTLTDEGSYEITRQAIDGSVNETYTVLIDKTAPNIAVNQADSVQGGAALGGLTINFSVQDEGGAGINGDECYECYVMYDTEYVFLDLKNDGYVETSISDNVYTFSCNYPAKEHGVKLKIIAVDNAGNENSVENEFNQEKGGCFIAGTKVSTPEGLKNIEEIKIGDIVYSYNEITEQIEEQIVSKTYVYERNAITTIKFENGEEIKNTEVHPYYVVGKGWVLAKHLEIGDEILTQDKTKVKIENIQTLEVDKINVYNIKVENNHNYFVGITRFLVHNKT